MWGQITPLGTIHGLQTCPGQRQAAPPRWASTLGAISTNFGSWFCPQLCLRHCHTTQLQYCPPVFDPAWHLMEHWPIALGEAAWCFPQPCSQSCIPSSHGLMLWEQSALQMLCMDQISSLTAACWCFWLLRKQDTALQSTGAISGNSSQQPDCPREISHRLPGFNHCSVLGMPFEAAKSQAFSETAE